jgi:hypothetical protein
VLRAVAAGAGIAAGILGIADRRGIDGIVVRPLDPALRLELEAVWRAPGRAAVGLLAAFLVDSSRDPRTVIEPPGRAGQAPVRT